MDFATEYPLNAKLVENNSFIEFFSVPFDSSYKNILDFKNQQEQEETFNNLVQKRVNKVNYVIKNNVIRISGNYKDYLYFNYLRYKNTTYENKYFYCFIEKIEYITENITEIYITTDVWQTWCFNLTYYDNYILRSHILKENDVVGYNVEKEPLSYSPEFEKRVDIFNNIDWNIRWCVQALSSAPATNGTDDFEYGGVGENASDFCSFYIAPLHSEMTADNIKTVLKWYYPDDKANDHRSDIICVKALPEWVVKNTPYAVQNLWLSNRVATITDTAKISTTTLPCGYVPKNKKMLTSAFRVLVVYNLNGLSIPLKPELLNTDEVSLALSMKGASSSTIRLTIGNYNAYTQTHYQIPYQATMGIAYNENTGLQQSMEKFNATMGLVNSVVGGATQIASGNYIGGATSLISGVANSGVQLKSAFEQKTASIGSATDTSCVLPYYIKLSLVDCSPTYSECEVIDRFLTMYGYQTNNIKKISEVMRTRSNFNYIQVEQANIKLNGIQQDLQKIKAIFENGVTVWHNLANFGNYDIENN